MSRIDEIEGSGRF